MDLNFNLSTFLQTCYDESTAQSASVINTATHR